ncbi:polysaccharide biosynthesis C-terminal domain-containing protein [Serratia ureilytica]
MGLPLAISSLSIVIYTRIDQIMLGNLVGEQAVGWFSAATTLVKAGFRADGADHLVDAGHCQLPRSVGAGVPYPGALSGGPGPVVAGVAGPVVVRPPGHCAAVRRRFPTGRQHPAICTLTSLFSVMGTVSYRSIVLFAGYRFIAIKMPLVAVANVVMNLLLIPRYGLIGAAVSTLLAEFISFFVLNSLFRGGKITRLQLTCFYCLPRLVSKLRREHVKHPG